MHVGEHGWGVALITDSTYGYDVSGDGAVPPPCGCLSCGLRTAPIQWPTRADTTSDTACGPPPTSATRSPPATRSQLPLRPASDRLRGKPLVSVDNPAVIVEAVKLADDRSGAVIVRLYESRGGRARAVLSADFPVTSVSETDLLERPLRPMASGRNAAALSLRPFQIVTLRLER